MQGPVFQCRLNGACSGGSGSLVWIHQVAKLLGRFEVGHPFGRDLHARSSLWVASDAGIALADAKGSEPANLNLVPSLQRPDHGPKDGLNNDLAIAASQVAQAGHL